MLANRRKRWKALVVDDDLSICDLFQLQLKREGWSPTTVQSGEVALSLLKEEDWDLVITDVVMPGMNGFTLAEEVRLAARGVPVIVMTGQSKHTKEDLLFSACAGFVSKPIDWPFFLKLMNTVTRRSLNSKEYYR